MVTWMNLLSSKPAKDYTKAFMQHLVEEKTVNQYVSATLFWLF